MESHRDITIDIPGLFLDSGAPTALLRIISPVFRASTTPPEQLGEYPPWIAEMCRNRDFGYLPRIDARQTS